MHLSMGRLPYVCSPGTSGQHFSPRASRSVPSDRVNHSNSSTRGVIDAPPPPSPPSPTSTARYLATAVDTAGPALQSAVRPCSNLRQFVRASLTDILIMNIVFYDCECRPRACAGALRTTGKVISPSGETEKKRSRARLSNVYIYIYIFIPVRFPRARAAATVEIAFSYRWRNSSAYSTERAYSSPSHLLVRNRSDNIAIVRPTEEIFRG